MCGIAGTIGKCDRAALTRMLAALTHRGPDGDGMEMIPEQAVGLVHTRLSILDLSPLGRQPMVDSTGRFYITFNGEIYNFQEVRAELSQKGYSFKSGTDTEVLLASFQQWGPKCLTRLNGMFAFAVWDKKEQILFAARDRVGIKPFYYAETEEGFVFGSEIKAILASGMVEAKPDYAALTTAAMYVVGPLTGFKGIYKLPPGYCLYYRKGKLTQEAYWEISPSETLRDEGQAIETLDSLLNDTVQKQMISDVPIGLLLSGGLDSSLLAALMTKHRGSAINTFTIKFRAADQKFEQMPEDNLYATKVATMFGCEHREIQIEPDVVDLLPKMVWHLDEPLADPASINTYLIARAAKSEGIAVLLNGMGGDEIFGGYRKQLACLMADSYQRYLPGAARTMIEAMTRRLPAASKTRGFRTTRWAKRFVSFASLPPASRFLASTLGNPADINQLLAGGIEGSPLFESLHDTNVQFEALERKQLSYLTRMCLCDTKYYMADHNLTYSDKCTMAVGVEGRPPLTDHRLVEFMFTTDPSLRIHRRVQKYLLKRVAEKYLPNEIIHRPKAPFGSPIRGWIRGPLSEMVGDLLSPEMLRKRGVFNAEYVTEKIALDRKGQEDWAHLIWKLLTTEIWFRTFFNGSVTSTSNS